MKTLCISLLEPDRLPGPLPVPPEPAGLAIAGSGHRAQGGLTAAAGGRRNISGVFSRKSSARSLLLLSLWSFGVWL